MKKLALLLLWSFAAIISFSCSKGKKNNLHVADFIIVGHVGGFVAFTSQFYKITSSQLLEDTTKYYGISTVPADVAKFNFNDQLSSARFDSVKNLLSSIPSELLSENNSDLGTICPDYGYTDVRASVNGTLYSWKFECDVSSTSTAVQQFVQQIRTDF